jgi:GT2 family glycosyltransferase
MTAKVDIIVVNWNSEELITALLDSFEKIKDKGSVGQLIIVDNASTDDSLKNINEGQWNLPIKLIQNKENLGFSRACNIGAREAKEKYILFLNPDTLIYEGSIAKSIEFLENDHQQEYGACGIQLVDQYNVPNRSCARIPSFKNFFFSSLGLNNICPRRFPGVLIREWQHNKTQDIGHVIGAFYLVRRDIFEKLNGFDERFFLYYEDLDFSTSLRNSGLKIAFLSDVRAVHVGGGCSQKIKAKRLSYSYLSKILYIRKHFPWYQSAALILVILTIEPVMRFLFYLSQFSIKDSLISIKGYFQFLGSGLIRLFGVRPHAER